MTEQQSRDEPSDQEQVEDFEEEAYQAKQSHGEEPGLAEEHEESG